MKGKKLFNKIAATGMTVAMVAAMGMPVFAEGYSEDPTTAASNQIYTTSVPVYKDLKTNAGTTVSATFNYSVTSDSSNPTGTPNISISPITVTKTDSSETTTTEDGTLSLPLATSFPAAGTYIYEITETAGDAHLIFASDGTEDEMTYDGNKYKMRIFIGYNSDGTALEYKGITVEDYKTGEKVDSTDTTKGIRFENSYWKDGGSGTTTTPGDKDTAFTLKKEISGQNKQSTDKFDFTVTFTMPSILPDNYTGPTTTASGATVTKNTDGTYTAKVTLTGGNSAVFNNVIAGTTYAVTETSESDNKATYTASYSVNGGDATNTAPTAQLISESANTLTVTNTTPDITITGIVNNYGGLIAVVAIAAVGIVMVMVRRRREA